MDRGWTEETVEGEGDFGRERGDIMDPWMLPSRVPKGGAHRIGDEEEEKQSDWRESGGIESIPTKVTYQG